MRHRKDRRLTVWLTEQQRHQIEARARQAGLGLGEYARLAIVHGRIFPREALEEIRALRIELNRVGVNMNQIARRLNMGDSVRLCEVLEQLSAVTRILKEVEACTRS